MIRSHRTWQRRAFVAIAVAYPLLCVASFLVQRPIPAMVRLPGETSDQTLEALPEDDSTALLDLDWVRGTQVPSARVRARRSLGAPDVLLYATREPADTVTQSGVLPKDAVLLGALREFQPRLIELPSAQGALCLYSLAHQRLLAVQPIPSVEVPFAEGERR